MWRRILLAALAVLSLSSFVEAGMIDLRQSDGTKTEMGGTGDAAKVEQYFSFVNITLAAMRAASR
jgi:hypothetical protein